jgi:hypothetical protein
MLVVSAPRDFHEQRYSTAQVQSTPGFDHPGILVSAVQNAARVFQWQKYLSLILLAAMYGYYNQMICTESEYNVSLADRADGSIYSVLLDTIIFYIRD